ncbi:Immunoglobulin omega chain [Tupaia chinensis]|nr:Immunoglobulin omega chain [Tupaia chinensis]
MSTMAWTPLLLMLLSHCTGSLSQPVLTQPPSLSASPGASARITCTVSSGFNVGDYWIKWYQQNPESPPRFLLNYYSESNKHQGSGVPSRFSGSKDTSANAGVLHIAGLQPEDEADYYCAIAHNSLSQSVLTQAPSLPASPGETVKLACTLSSDISVSGYNMYWDQQKPGSPPWWFLYYYSDSDKQLGPGVCSRVSGSKDTSKNTAFLHIPGLQAEDEAEDYCQIRHSSTSHSDTHRWRSGTKTFRACR